MLRGFLLVFVLASIVIVAMAGFRGEHSPRTPWEIFPDMVRQQKVRAQSPIDFFADGRGPRLPIANTVPIGYEMPKPQQKALPGIPPPANGPQPERVANRIGFSVGTDYYNTGKMGNNWGTGIPVPVTEQLMQRGQQRFNINPDISRLYPRKILPDRVDACFAAETTTTGDGSEAFRRVQFQFHTASKLHNDSVLPVH